MVDYSTEGTLREAALALRVKHDALEWDAKVNDLIQLEGYAQHRYQPKVDPFNLEALIQKQNKPKVKALVSIKDRVIMLSDDIHSAREAFANAHELGHSVIEWHQQILYACDEHDLSASTQAQMEWEANTFASAVLFPKPLMAQIYEEYPATMDTILHLKNLTNASIESAGIAYASQHPGICLLMVLDPLLGKDAPGLRLQRKSLSTAAVKNPLSKLAPQQTFKPPHTLWTHSRGSGVEETGLRIGDAPNKYRVSILNNQYKVLALVTQISAS